MYHKLIIINLKARANRPNKCTKRRGIDENYSLSVQTV